MKRLIVGYGSSGKSAEALARRLGDTCAVLADERRDTVAAALASLGGSADVAVVSPGIALTHPWLRDCRAQGIPLESELAFGCRELRRRGVRLLAVTGSKGKSSVVKIVADAVNLDGRKAVACGNYGKPVTEVAAEDGWDWAVVEVSSFMMETTELPSDTFESAAILNLQEDHLDRHGTREAYHALKRRLLTMTARPYDFSDGHLPAESLRCLAGSYFDNEILRVNGAAARALMDAVTPGLADGTPERAFAGFKPLPHRMNRVAEIDGVLCIDDSKATSVAALVAGVKMASRGNGRTVRLIAGGLAKGDDPKMAISILTARVKKVYIIGQCAEEFFKAWKDSVDCEVCGVMERAVKTAMQEAERGDIVLLSPGTASFDQFKSFGERGDVFARLVQKERQKNT